jgi:cytochrome c oxidase subunit 3
MTAIDVALDGRPVAAARHPGRPLGWWGMVTLIVTEATIFAGLLSSYFFLRASSRQWPQGGIHPPELPRISAFTFFLLASSAPLIWAEAAVKRDHLGQVWAALMLSFVLGGVFLANQVLEYRTLGFGIRDNAYASIFYATTGLHGAHVAIGLLMNLIVQLKVRLGRLSPERHLTLSVFALYWHFVDVVWIFVFSSLYLSPHIR